MPGSRITLRTMTDDTAYELEAARASGDARKLADALQRHALVLLQAGMAEDAREALHEAEALYLGCGADGEAAACRAALAAPLPVVPAVEAELPAEQAESALEQIALRLAQGDSAGAVRAALQARDAAQQAASVPLFVAAVSGQAQLHEYLGDPVSAHAAALGGRNTLAGWAGEEAADSAFAALFDGQRQRWGEDEYARIAALLDGGSASG